LFQGKVVKALFRLLPPVHGISDMRAVVHQAWYVTRDLVTPIAPIGIDRMDRNQFRVLCIYLWYHIKLWDLFVQLSDVGTENRKVTLKQFEEMLPFIRGWGIPSQAMWESNPDACFEAVDRSMQGWVMFEDLAEFILRCAVPQLSAAGEEDSRAEAIRLLTNTHPQLMVKEWPKKERNWNGAVPPVPPPGQRRPPMNIDSDDMGPGGMTSPKNNRRFKTQYMCDYQDTKYMPTSRDVTAASSRSTSRVLTRASTPPARPPSDLATGIALIRSSSMPDATMRTQGLDKQALRMKLENHLDMYSTGQMRKILKVAGGMAVAGR